MSSSTHEPTDLDRITIVAQQNIDESAEEIMQRQICVKDIAQNCSDDLAKKYLLGYANALVWAANTTRNAGMNICLERYHE